MEIIYAIDSNNGLCKNGTIPWRSKKDMSFFINKTKNNVVIMGKNTFFSIPDENRHLKNRLNIDLTNDPQLYDASSNPEYSNVLFTNNANIHHDILQNRDQYSDKYRFLKSDLFIDYDYSTDFLLETYYEDDELRIVEYNRVQDFSEN